MATTEINGLQLAYELIGDSGPTWILTPGGRYTKEQPGVPELATKLADAGNRVLIWDRPNCGESDVCFEGETESDMQADALAALLKHLDLAPAIILGGSGGARVSLLAAAKHPEVARALAMLWISGGPFGLLTLAVHYCAGSLKEAWREDMAAVANLAEWQEVVERNPRNRQRFLDQDRREFVTVMERWMMAYCPRDGQTVPGLPDSLAQTISVPSLVFRSGASDCYHTRATSEALAGMIPDSQLVEPPWPDTEWYDAEKRRAQGKQQGPFDNWPMLAPQLLKWAAELPPVG